MTGTRAEGGGEREIPGTGRGARASLQSMAMGERHQLADTPSSFEDAYRAHRLALVRLAYLLTSDRFVAEELVQDAFAASERVWATVQDPRSYLRSAVVNRCRSWLRRARLERSRQPERAASVELHADEMWDALGRLSPRRRAAIVLRFYEDLPDDEIARLLGCRPATVRTVVHRALADLRREMGRA